MYVRMHICTYVNVSSMSTKTSPRGRSPRARSSVVVGITKIVPDYLYPNKMSKRQNEAIQIISGWVIRRVEPAKGLKREKRWRRQGGMERWGEGRGEGWQLETNGQ